MANARPDVVVLEMVRLSFPKIWKMEKSTPDSPPKFSANFLIDPDTAHGKKNIAKIEAALKHVKTKAWPENTDKIVSRIDAKRISFREGEAFANAEGDVYQGYDDMMVVTASNKKRFQIVDRDKSPLTEDDGKPYGGCYVDAVVSFYATTKKEQGGNGLFATIELIRFRKDGEAFGAAPIDADDYLADLSDDEDEDDMI